MKQYDDAMQPSTKFNNYNSLYYINTTNTTVISILLTFAPCPHKRKGSNKGRGMGQTQMDGGIRMYASKS